MILTATLIATLGYIEAQTGEEQGAEWDAIMFMGFDLLMAWIIFGPQ